MMTLVTVKKIQTQIIYRFAFDLKFVNKNIPFFLSIFTGSLIYEHYTRECEFGNFDKIKNTKHKKTKQHKKTQKLLAEFLFK